MKNLKQMTDYALVEKVQSFKSDCHMKGVYLGELYTRYLRLIHKHAGILFSKFPEDHTVYEDFIQDAYFAVIRAAEGVKPEKVTPGWKFHRVLWSRLQKLRTAYMKSLQHRAAEVPEELTMFPLEASGDSFSPTLPPHMNAYKYLNVDLYYYQPYTSLFLDEQKQFYAELSPWMRRVLALRRKGHPMAKIAKQLGVPYSRVQRGVKESKQIARQVFQVAHY